MIDTTHGKTGRSDGIDALRAFFALWVLLAHSVPWSTLGSGSDAPIVLQQLMRELIGLFQAHGETHPAVLGFIVLSGYCIHRSGLGRSASPVRRYAVKRAFRILPVYLAGIAVGVILWLYAVDINAPVTRAISGTEVIRWDCLVKRVTTVGQLSPDLFDCTFQGNAPLNTVSAEIGLYVLYPLVLLAGLSLGAPRRLVFGLLATFLVAGIIVSNVTGMVAWWNNGTAFGFFVYWWIGALFNTDAFRARRGVLLVLSLAIWSACTLALLQGLDALFILSETRKLAFALIVGAIVCYSDRPSLPTFGLAFIGLSGYSIYAFHAPVVYTLVVLGADWIVAVISAVLIGIGAYFVLEKPMMRLGRKVNQRADRRA